MGQIVVYSFGIALFLVIFGTMALNRLGIIPVIRIGSLVKLLLVLSLIFFVILSFSKCSDDRKAAQQEKESAKILSEDRKNITGYWKKSDNGNCLKITDDTISGLFKEHNMPELDEAKYELSAPNVITIFNPNSNDKEPLHKVKYAITEDKNTMEINDGISGEIETYKRATKQEYEASLTQKSEPANTNETEETELEAQLPDDVQAEESEGSNKEEGQVFDVIDMETAKRYIIGSWKDRDTGKIIKITDTDYISGKDAVSKYEFESNSMISITTNDGNGNPVTLYFSCFFSNYGKVMALGYEEEETGNKVEHTYDRIGN